LDGKHREDDREGDESQATKAREQLLHGALARLQRSGLNADLFFVTGTPSPWRTPPPAICSLTQNRAFTSRIAHLPQLRDRLSRSEEGQGSEGGPLAARCRVAAECRFAKGGQRMTAGADTIKQAESALVEARQGPGGLGLGASGVWTVRTVGAVDRQLSTLAASARGSAEIDLSRITHLDTAGAWLIHRTRRDFERRGIRVSMSGADSEAQSLIEAVATTDRPPEAPEPRAPYFTALLAGIGERAERSLSAMRDALGFTGLVLETLGRSIIMPTRLRFTSLVYHMEEAGLKAVPIVALMSFLIGAVLAFQGAGQLQRFGAEPYTVNLVAVSFLREVGILLTAIMVAGRSGSAFTAQIGSMKMREEIDAIRTLGLDPIELLVLPRVLALVLTLPLLGFIGDMMGLLGGMVICWLELGMSPSAYISILREAVDEWSFWVGIIKAPVFAFLIAVIGCFEGMRVTGTAESVGQRTTQSVVEGIFTVIIADAFFSIVFQELGI
jgi:phospholipid/cholesterol/gamma-HCH transport system permease protein